MIEPTELTKPTEPNSLPRVALVAVSSNRKTGPMAVSTSTSETCPDSCPLKTGGCYAKQGNTRLHWKALDDGKRGTDWSTFLAKVKALPRNSPFRHNEAGDLPHDSTTGMIDREATLDLARACNSRNLRAWTYTHHKVTYELPLEPSLPDPQYIAVHNQETISSALLHGFTINLSANNQEEADAYKALRIAPVCVVLPMQAENVSYTPKGHKIVACPAEKSDKVTCSTCNLCSDPDRQVIIGFRAHGTSKRKAEAIALDLHGTAKRKAEAVALSLRIKTYQV